MKFREKLKLAEKKVAQIENVPMTRHPLNDTDNTHRDSIENRAQNEETVHLPDRAKNKNVSTTNIGNNRDTTKTLVTGNKEPINTRIAEEKDHGMQNGNPANLRGKATLTKRTGEQTNEENGQNKRVS